jgi:hypothetical protein
MSSPEAVRRTGSHHKIRHSLFVFNNVINTPREACSSQKKKKRVTTGTVLYVRYVTSGLTSQGRSYKGIIAIDVIARPSWPKRGRGYPACRGQLI